MPVKINLFPVKDFTGGLNLRAAPLQLGDNESPEMLNVDIDPRGGIRMRKCCTTMNTTPVGGLASRLVSMWEFANSSGVEQVMVSRYAAMYYSTGTDFTAIPVGARVGTGKHRATTFKDNCYIQNGWDPVAKWDGATVSVMADPAPASWNNDYAVVGVNKMVASHYIATHMGMVFVANTRENSTAYPNRVRFSHPNQPESWREIDYIDIDTGHDGDVITGIVPFGGRLFVFKNHSIHAIHGYSPETFQVVEISGNVGATSQEAIAVSPQGIYFFSWPGGVYALGGQGQPVWLWERLHPLIEDGGLEESMQEDFTVGWLNKRLWVCVATAGEDLNRQYVYDPTLQKQGGWVKYDFPLGQIMEWNPLSEAPTFLGIGLGDADGRVLQLEIEADNDTYDNVTAVPVATTYTSRWYDLDAPAVKKRWKSPEFVFNAKFAASVRVDCYRDYDPSQITRTFFADVVPKATAGVWDTSLWDEFVWGSEDLGAEQIIKGSLLGAARAVRIKLTGPTPSARWSMDAVTFKYIPLRVRA